jgi:hypothetical protein
MTGGTALPADTNPSKMPGTPDQPADVSGPAGASQPPGLDPSAGAIAPGGTGQPDGPDQPRLFFAQSPDQAAAEQPAVQPPLSQQPPSQPPPAAQPYYQQPPAQQPFQQQPPFSQQPPGQPPFSQQPFQQRPPAGQRPARQRPTRRPDRELRQRAIASLVLGILALVAMFGLGADLKRGVFVLIFSAVVGIGSCIIGITAILKARKTGTLRPGGAVGGIVFGVLATVISVPILATYLAFPGPLNNYVNCLSQAQSSSQQHACVSKFYNSVHLGDRSATMKRG